MVLEPRPAEQRKCLRAGVSPWEATLSEIENRKEATVVTGV